MFGFVLKDLSSLLFVVFYSLLFPSWCSNNITMLAESQLGNRLSLQRIFDAWIFWGGHLNDVCASHSVKKTTLPGFFDLLETGYHNTEIVSWNKYIQVASFYLAVHHLLLRSQRRFSFSWGKVHAVIDGSSIYSLKWQFWKHISLTTQRVGGQWKGGDNWGSWKWNDVHVCQMPFPF